PVIVEAGTGIHASRTADLLEKVIDGGFQPEILEGGGHEAMRDIADELDGIIDDRLGIINTLQLGGLVEVDQVLVQVQTGGSQQWSRVVVQIGGDTLAFLFLEPD